MLRGDQKILWCIWQLAAIGINIFDKEISPGNLMTDQFNVGLSSS